MEAQKPEAKKPGRPRKNPEEKRKNRGVLYLTDEEYSHLKNRARMADKTITEYVRDALGLGVKRSGSA